VKRGKRDSISKPPYYPFLGISKTIRYSWTHTSIFVIDINERTIKLSEKGIRGIAPAWL
jgi:hypothetical protein